jgi:hypothetical protein
MNEDLQIFARNTILEGLESLPESSHQIFRWMYGRDNGKRSIEDTEKMSIASVVAEMPPERLDWAMMQIKASLLKASTPKDAP